MSDATSCTELIFNCGDCLKQCWPIVVALAPTILVGLTRYRSGGVLGAVITVLDRLSVCSHADSPSTFKVPGKRSKAPEAK